MIYEKITPQEELRTLHFIEGEHLWKKDGMWGTPQGLLIIQSGKKNVLVREG